MCEKQRRCGENGGECRVALVLALYLLLCVRVTADICAGAAKGQIVFSADVGALAFHAQVSGWVKGRRIQMRFPLPKFKTKSDKKEFRRRWLIARAVLHAADWELIALHVRTGLEDAGATAMLAGGIRALADGLLAGAGRTDCGDIRIMADFASQDAAATARCIVSMRAGDIMLAAARAAVKKKRNEGQPWRSIPSKA